MRKKSQKLVLSRETLLALAPAALEGAEGGWATGFTTVSADSCVGSCGPSYCRKCISPPASNSPTGCCYETQYEGCIID